MKAGKLNRLCQASVNGPSLERSRLQRKQSIPASSINVHLDASSRSATQNQMQNRRNHQTSAKLIFTRLQQQDTKVLEARRGTGSWSSGSVPLAFQRQPLVAVVVVVIVSLILVTANFVAPTDGLEVARSTPSRLPAAMASLPPLQFDGRPLIEMLGTNLIQTLASLPQRVQMGNRWANVGGLLPTLTHQQDTLTSSDRAPPSQTPLLARRPGPLMQALSRLSRRIGARNSIRFHNAFRDLAWKLLASLSMPTPIIYELRRRQLYSAEEDQWNDSLASKNTSMTIRTRRQLEPSDLTKSKSRADDEDEDESDNNLSARIRLRLEDLVSLSRRSLFGRVIRLPALFPFKRQQQEDNAVPEVVSTGTKPVHHSSLVGLLPSLKLRANKEESSDHQKIFIDGKQYYIDDDGELKELTSKVYK